MPLDFATSNSEVLNSWKEVALYLGRGVRTVQRWEQELGLPVRRPRGRARSAVLALKPELDTWLLQTAQNTTPVINLPCILSFIRTLKYSRRKLDNYWPNRSICASVHAC